MKKKKNENKFPEFTYLQYEFEREIQCFRYNSLLIAEISNYYPNKVTLYISDGQTMDKGYTSWSKLSFNEMDSTVLENVKIFIGIIQKYGFINYNFVAMNNLANSIKK